MEIDSRLLDIDTITEQIYRCYTPLREGKLSKPDTAALYRRLDDPNTVIHGELALSFAASYADHAAVKYLLARGADPFGRAPDGRTALHAVVQGPGNGVRKSGLGIYHTVAALHWGGVKSDAVCYPDKQTASHLAAACGCYEFVYALFSCGQAQHLPDSRGDTPLHTACRAARAIEQKLEILMDSRGQPIGQQNGADAQNEQGRIGRENPQVEEAYRALSERLECQFETVYILLVTGLDLGAANQAGETAKDILLSCAGGQAAMARAEIPFISTMTPDGDGRLRRVQALCRDVLIATGYDGYA